MGGPSPHFQTHLDLPQSCTVETAEAAAVRSCQHILGGLLTPAAMLNQPFWGTPTFRNTYLGLGHANEPLVVDTTRLHATCVAISSNHELITSLRPLKSQLSVEKAGEAKGLLAKPKSTMYTRAESSSNPGSERNFGQPEFSKQENTHFFKGHFLYLREQSHWSLGSIDVCHIDSWSILRPQLQVPLKSCVASDVGHPLGIQDISDAGWCRSQATWCRGTTNRSCARIRAGQWSWATVASKSHLEHIAKPQRLMDAQWINVFNPTHLYCSFPFFSLATRHISDEQT